jgi:hypothetical protein
MYLYLHTFWLTETVHAILVYFFNAEIDKNLRETRININVSTKPFRAPLVPSGAKKYFFILIHFF